jgi:heme-degrading monooxygenase HmoA
MNRKEGFNMAVTLINVFSVPNGKEVEFENWWQDVKTNITAEKGFISGAFHRSIKPDSRYNFINIALWENEEVYWKAYEKSVTPMKRKLEQLGVEMVPALYRVELEY